MRHLEIVNVLKKIQNLPLEFNQLERKINFPSDIKKRLSLEEYQNKVLHFEDNRKKNSLLQKIQSIGLELQQAKPDFISSFSSPRMLLRLEEVLKGHSLNERMQKQLELAQILEVKNQFQTIHNFIDKKNMPKLKKILKGSK